MVCFRKLVLAAVASGILSLGSALRAGVIYDNLPPLSTSGGTDAIYVDGPAYNSFSTGDTASQLLDVKLFLSGTLGSRSSFTVSLLSDSSSTPGTPGSLLTTLGTFSDSTLNFVAPSVYDISVANYDLAPDTRYWIELSGASSVAAWSYASNVTGAGIGGEYNAYSPGGDLTVSPNTHDTAPYLMRVTTTQTSNLPPVIVDPTPNPPDPNPPNPPSSLPEPGTLCQALTALAIGTVVIARRRIIGT